MSPSSGVDAATPIGAPRYASTARSLRAILALGLEGKFLKLRVCCGHGQNEMVAKGRTPHAWLSSELSPSLRNHTRARDGAEVRGAQVWRCTATDSGWQLRLHVLPRLSSSCYGLLL